MGSPEFSCGHNRVVDSKTSSLHEPQGFIDPVSQFLIPIEINSIIKISENSKGNINI